MTEKSTSTSTAPLEVTRWQEVGRCRIEVDDDAIADGAKSTAECSTPSGTPGKRPTSIGLTLARTYLEACGYTLLDSVPSGFDIVARDGGTEVMAKVRVFAEPFDVDELDELFGSEGLRRAALAHIAETLPSSARVDLIGIALGNGGRAQIRHLGGVFFAAPPAPRRSPGPSRGEPMGGKHLFPPPMG